MIYFILHLLLAYQGFNTKKDTHHVLFLFPIALHLLHWSRDGHGPAIPDSTNKQQHRQPSAKHLHNKQRLPHRHDRARENISHIRHIHHKILYREQ